MGGDLVAGEGPQTGASNPPGCADELLDLPAAIQHLSERIEALAEAQQRTEQQMEALAGRTDTLASGMDHLRLSFKQR
ncbi:MAG: hypothetical protein ACRDIA_04190 [Actinomycetota bacterium]